jgi:hypothetical protein
MAGLANPATNFLLLTLALVTATSAGIVLVVEFFGNKTLARRAPGVFSAILAAVGVGAAVLNGPTAVAIGAGALAALILLLWPISFERPRQFVLSLVTAKSVWITVLIAGLAGSRFFAAKVLQSLDEPEPAAAVDLEDVPILSTEAVTDKGRSIPLFHFKVHSAAAEAERFIHADEKELSQFIRMGEANPAANCHGWVFTGGKYGIRDPEIAGILSDNAYSETAEPRPGDLAIYTSDLHITHSGVVRIVNPEGPVLVESKWGPFGVYLHAVEQQPFPGKCRYYRSARPDHLLALQSPHDGKAVGTIRRGSRLSGGQLFAFTSVSGGHIEVERDEPFAARVLDLVRVTPLN